MILFLLDANQALVNRACSRLAPLHVSRSVANYVVYFADLFSLLKGK